MEPNTMALITLGTGRNDLIQSIAAKAYHFMSKSKAENTLKAYRRSWDHFSGWCLAHGMAAMPAEPQTIALYIADMAGVLKPATISLRLAAISKAHQVAGFDSPCAMRHACVKETLAGIRREKGIAQTGKAALLTADIRCMVEALPDGLRGKRDAALLLLGFAGAFRRSELAGLMVDDLDFCEEGLKVTLRRSKTDQEGRGRTVGIPYGSDPRTCPVRAVRRWLEAGQIPSGPVFRAVLKGDHVPAKAIGHDGILFIVKRSCQAVGLDASKFGAHSLRAGFCTQSAMQGASERSIMRTTGHTSHAMVGRYIRDTDLFRENAAVRLGL